MIDTIIEEQQTTCKACGKLLTQSRGHRQRQYCDEVCKQAAYRARKGQQPNGVTIVTIDDTMLQARIAELEHQVKELSARLALEDVYRYDTQERHFKSWLRKHPQARDTTEVFKRILADTRLPQHGSRSLYEARLRLHGYSAEEIALFQGAWRDMMFMQG